ncbi:type VII secretion integral membrane protein EccD [Nakamurella deserti]|uniref:type VII secretion integral membrane protein EccD n=1 Tax=Nakamurella deserti TaxID=2164074 RepID=UPI000DBE795F|nr:type VII secretion integral membrane protein EccD [Nakamurella deserti]
MHDATSTTHRRVAVMVPTGRVDLVVPAELTVADLVPVVLELGRVAADTSGHGWHLGRVGRPALDPERSLPAAGVRDGDLLDLRPSTLSGVAPVFDEITDAAAAVAADSIHARRSFARPSALATAALLLALSVVQAWTGGSAASSAAVAVVLLVAACRVARRMRDHPVAVVLGSAAVGFSAAAVAVWAPGPDVATAVAATVAGVALVATRLVAAGRPVFVALAGTGLMVSAGRAASQLLSWSSTEAAAIAVVVAVAVLPLVPRVASRATGLRRAAWSGRAGVSGDGLPAVMASARRAVDTVAGLYAAVSVLGCGAGTVLTGAGGLAVVLGVVVPLVFLLRTRSVAVPTQAAALGLPAVLSLLVGGALIVRQLSVSPGVMTVGGVIVACMLLAVGRHEAGHHRPPSWGRVPRFVEGVSVLSVVPLAVAVVDGYRAVRHW